MVEATCMWLYLLYSQMRDMDIGCIRMYSKPWIFVLIPVRSVR